MFFNSVGLCLPIFAASAKKLEKQTFQPTVDGMLIILLAKPNKPTS